METLNYKVLEQTGYDGYILKDAPVKVMQFGEGNFLRAFVDYFYDIANEKAGKVMVPPMRAAASRAGIITREVFIYMLLYLFSEWVIFGLWVLPFVLCI